MPTPYIKKMATKKGKPVAEIEAEWEKAKKSVNRSKYDDDDQYYAVVTTVFKKMIGESRILSFEEFTQSQPEIHYD
jgi:predicted transglutaminase-like protease